MKSNSHIFLKAFIYLAMTSLVCAEISILASPFSADFIRAQKDIHTFIEPDVEKDEVSVMQIFGHENHKFAIVRSDILTHLYRKNLHTQRTAYSIIGRFSLRAVLYFASDDANTSLSHKTYSIGKIGDMAGVYLKKILKQSGLLYSVNLRTQDAFRSLSAFRHKQIDGLFLFSSEKFGRIMGKNLKPYPEGFREVLRDEGLVCPEDEYCYASYYLISLDRVGKKVMQNIYQKFSPHFDRGRSLEEEIGKYYVHIKLTKPKIVMQPSTTSDDVIATPLNIKMPHFGRAPWMDVAVAEAMQGRGSTEYVLPMLDLSYKYIRFSKGSSGVTTAPNDNVEGSWCAAYICWTLDRSGYKVHKSGRMASQSFRYLGGKLYRKIKNPIFGAITVFTNMRKPGHGHVGYLFGHTETGRMIVLGGNQGNRLKFSTYSRHFGSYKLSGFYVPMNYQVTDKDKLTHKDVYRSVHELNRKYGIMAGRRNNSVR